MLQFFNRDKSWYETLESHWFESFKYWDVNTVTIEWNPKPYVNKICYIYFEGRLVWSGIVWWYRHSKNENKGELHLYPLIQDLQTDFLGWYAYLIAENNDSIIYETGDRVVVWDPLDILSYDDDIANIIEDIIYRYTVYCPNPILYMKEKQLTGINLKYDFVNTTFLEAFNFIVNKFIGTESSVLVENDGWVVIRSTADVHNLTYWNDILRIEYEEDISEIVNAIRFTNNKTWLELIAKSYEDTDSILEFQKRVLFISDERFVYEVSVDEYCNNVLAKKWRPRIIVESINTLRSDIRLYDKVSISNWEKNFDDNLFVNSITYSKDWFYSLDIGTKESKQDLLSL
jgi:hypothetical protein